MRRLGILGASGHGKVVADMAASCGWEDVVFYDDAWPQIDKIGAWPVIGDSKVLLQQLSRLAGVIVAIGNNTTRSEKLEWLTEHNANIISLVHPSAVMSRFAQVGKGVVVMPGVVVNADTQIGDGVILNTCCSVDHDCTLGRCVHISPGARLAGGVTVGNLSWVGIGASIKQSVCIGVQVMVGAGAAVITDLPTGVTALGVPARALDCQNNSTH